MSRARSITERPHSIVDINDVNRPISHLLSLSFSSFFFYFFALKTVTFLAGNKQFFTFSIMHFVIRVYYGTCFFLSFFFFLTIQLFIIINFKHTRTELNSFSTFMYLWLCSSVIFFLVDTFHSFAVLLFCTESDINATSGGRFSFEY